MPSSKHPRPRPARPAYRPSYAVPTTPLSIPPLAARDIPALLPEWGTVIVSDTPLYRASSIPGYILAEHLVPSARPRASPTATTRQLRLSYPHPPVQGPSVESKTQRAKAIEDTLSQMRAQRQHILKEPSWTGDPRAEPQLYNHIIRLLPTQKPGAHSACQTRVCLLFAHANGFPKELWMPVVRRLVERGLPVAEVILWEAVNHGSSAVVNAHTLGDTYDWVDNARDIILFLKHYHGNAGGLPLIAVGHSLGGVSLTRAALHEPSLFSALILIEPIIFPEFTGTRRASEEKRYDWLITTSLARRSVWRDRAEAKATFLRAGFFRSWDPEVLDLYVKWGLTEHPSGKGVMLKQSPYDEAAVFAEPIVGAEVYNLLPTLPDSVALKWIMSGKDAKILGGEEMCSHTVWRRPANCENVRIPEAGHLIPHERPDIIADEVATFISERYGLEFDVPRWLRARF